MNTKIRFWIVAILGFALIIAINKLLMISNITCYLQLLIGIATGIFIFDMIMKTLK